MAQSRLLLIFSFFSLVIAPSVIHGGHADTIAIQEASPLVQFNTTAMNTGARGPGAPVSRADGVQAPPSTPSPNTIAETPGTSGLPLRSQPAAIQNVSRPSLSPSLPGKPSGSKQTSSGNELSLTTDDDKGPSSIGGNLLAEQGPAAKDGAPPLGTLHDDPGETELLKMSAWCRARLRRNTPWRQSQPTNYFSQLLSTRVLIFLCSPPPPRAIAATQQS